MVSELLEGMERTNDYCLEYEEMRIPDSFYRFRFNWEGLKVSLLFVLIGSIIVIWIEHLIGRGEYK